jgi:hypothetical protein
MCFIHPRRQRGQALVEFLVVAAALIPLFLLIPYIGKYQDIAHATEMASRYVAFDAMNRNDAMSSWKPESQLADEVRRRFFSEPGAAVKTYDVAGDFEADRNKFWRDPGNRPLIEKFSDVSVSFGMGAGNSHAAGFSSANDGDLFTLRSAAKLKAHGIYTADVTVKLLNLPEGIASLEPFDRLNLSMTRSTAVVFDPWAANGSAQAESRVRGLVPLPAWLSTEPISMLLGLGIQAADLSLPRPPSPTFSGQVVPPQFDKLERWRDVVPADRLRDHE